MIEPTEEMAKAFGDAWETTDPIPGVRLRAALAAVLAIVERDYEIEVAKLRGACHLAGQSRNLWKQRALDAGWTPVTPPGDTLRGPGRARS